MRFGTPYSYLNCDFIKYFFFKVGVTCSSAVPNTIQYSTTYPKCPGTEIHNSIVIRLISMWVRVILPAGRSTSWKHYSNSSVFYCSSVSHSIKSSFITDIEGVENTSLVFILQRDSTYSPWPVWFVSDAICHKGAWWPPRINTHINTQWSWETLIIFFKKIFFF